MHSLSEKQIWDEVFDGSILTAIEWTRSQQNNDISDTEISTQKSLKPLALYLEPSLNSANGHQLALASCYQDLFAKQGYQTRIIHALKNSLESSEERTPYFLVKHHTMSSRNICSLADLEKVECYFLSQFQSLVEKYNPDVCVFTTTRFTNIFPAAKSVVNNHTKFVIFGVMEAAEVPDCDDSDIIKSAYSRAAILLQQHQISHLLITENAHIRDFLLGCGFNKESVKVFPYVAARLITAAPVEFAYPSNRIQIGYLGGSRPVRHPELIADLITKETLPESADFKIQLDLNYIKSHRGAGICEQIIRLDQNHKIKLYPPNMSNQQYRSLFCSLDFIILPYGERYQQIGSGILLEAIYAGVIPILPAASELSELYQSLGGEAPCFQSLNSASIKTAIVNGLSKYSTLKNAINRVRKNWIKHPTSGNKWQSELSHWLSFTMQ